jgi:hypothetical protein
MPLAGLFPLNAGRCVGLPVYQPTFDLLALILGPVG